MEMKKNKKIIVVIIVAISICFISIGITYALWIIKKEQHGENVVTTSCLDFNIINEENDITLTNTFPKTDTEGKLLTPYKFTIKNNCNDYVDYNINIEMTSDTTLDSENIKVLINKQGDENNAILLSDYLKNEVVKKEGMKESRQLHLGRLKKNENVSFELRLWLKEDLTLDSGVENQVFKSKIIIEGKIGEKTAVDYIEDLALTDATNLSYDGKESLGEKLGTDDNNLRYIGANPNNYVRFNNELWRIIGVMKVPTENGIKEERLKIMRNKGIEGQNDLEYMYWDIKNINNWTTSALKDTLNSIYYNSDSGNCYTTDLKIPSTCDFTQENGNPKGLNKISQDMVDKDIIWNIGAQDTYYANAKTFYDAERGVITYSKTTPKIWSKNSNTNFFNGIGLPYASDYGYAVGGDSRDLCLDTNLWDRTLTVCKDNDWIKPNIGYYWLITPNSLNYVMYGLGSDGKVSINTVTMTAAIVPTLYLKSNVRIEEDKSNNYGSISNPFRLVNE